MKRLLVLVVPAVLAGCYQPTSSERVVEPTAPTDAMPQAPMPGISSEIDFANWPAATDAPYRVDPNIAAACRAAPSPAQLQAREAERKRHGPHYTPAIIVRVNPEAIAAFKAGAPLPVGTTIIKEKHHDELAKDQPVEYGAMIKREPGYDPTHGDWEYLYVVLKPQKTVTRGVLESCIDCHSHAREKDYLFRTYLPVKVGTVPVW